MNKGIIEQEGRYVGTITTLRPSHCDPEAISVVQVIETQAGDMRVIASEGMTRASIVGNLMLAAVHMASPAND